jgi:hypothetical protein
MKRQDQTAASGKRNFLAFHALATPRAAILLKLVLFQMLARIQFFWQSLLEAAKG